MKKTYNSVTVFLIVFAALYLIGSGECKHYKVENGSRNITTGKREHHDQLLFSDRVTKSGKFLSIISKDVLYPPKNDARKITITYFQVIDQYNSHGGYAYHTLGGIGLGFVGFHLKSKRGYGFDFKIEIFGYNH